jgi:hypothetical protein
MIPLAVSVTVKGRGRPFRLFLMENREDVGLARIKPKALVLNPTGRLGYDD